MSCCGQKRSALRQQAAPRQPTTLGQPSAQDQRRGHPPLKAAMLAFLARRAMSSGTGSRPGRVSRGG
jgi:hypothetical protein